MQYPIRPSCQILGLLKVRTVAIAPNATSTPVDTQGSEPVRGSSQNQTHTTANVASPRSETARSIDGRPRVSRRVSGQARITIQDIGTKRPIRCQPVASRSQPTNSGP